MEHTQSLIDNLVPVIQRLINAPDRADERLLEVCFAVLTLEASDSLQSIPAQERESWAEYIQSYQHQDSGLFGEYGQVETGEVTALERVSLEALRLTHFTLHALSALNWIASHRLHFAGIWTREGSDTHWLNELDWTDSVLTSEWLMYLLGSLTYRVEVETDQPSAALYHHILDWLERRQDQKSGLWELNRGASLKEAIVASCHFFPYFGYVNRPVMRISHMADCCLHLLQSNYSNLSDVSSEKFYSGTAAMSLLSAIHRISPYRRNEIAETLLHARETMQNALTDYTELLSAAQDQKIVNKRVRYAISDELRQKPLLLACLYQIAVLEAVSDVELETHPPEGLGHRRPILGCSWTRKNGIPAEQGLLPVWERPYRVPAVVQSSPAPDQPSISVVMPCYNLGIFLHEALQSILDQTFQKFEIVLVDDGSTDEYTRWVLSQLDLPRTRVIRQENRGLAAARNVGIQHAHGDYICCLDSDDRLRPGYFAAATPILNAQPEVAIVTGWLKVFDERDGDYIFKEFTFADLLANNQVITPALFRKSAWEQVGGYCDTFSSAGIEDWDFWISIYEAGYRAHLLPEVLFDYRIRMDAMSASMYEPEVWQRMIAELIQRHRTAYAEHLEAVLEKLNYHWADARSWAINLDRGLTWWERQSGVWQHEAEQGITRMQSLENRIRDLERQREWIAPRTSGVRRAAWYLMGKRLGFIQSNPLDEEEPDDQP